MRFTKMEGAGNDYLYINGFEEQVDDPAALSVRMSRQHFGCGSDGLILILPSDAADFRMRMFNNDGSESGMCGNGIRCVAKYCHDRGLTDKTEFTVESGGEIKLLRLTLAPDGTTQSVRVDMGAPQLDGAKIPSAAVGCPVIGHPVQVGERTYAFTLVNMGNPHAVCFVEDPDTAPVTTDGPVVEHHADFPQRINVEFVKVENRGTPAHARVGARHGRDAGLRHGRVRGGGGGVPQRPVRPQRGGDAARRHAPDRMERGRRARIPDRPRHLRV